MIEHQEYASDYFVCNRRILILAGLWIPDFQSKISLFLFKLFAIIALLFAYIWYTVSEFISLKDTYTNLEFFIKNINFGLMHLLGLLKCLLWYFKGHEYKKLIAVIETVEFRYENDDDFKPGSITREYKKTGIKYALSFLISGYLTVISSYVPLYVKTIVDPTYVIEENGNETFSQSLPYFSWFPFDYNTPTRYIWALSLQFIPVAFYAFGVVGMDTLFMNIMNFIAAHFIIIQGAFRTIRKRCIKRMDRGLKHEYDIYNSEALDNEMMQEMKKLVNHLQAIINVAEKLEELNKYLTLLQLLATLFMFCTSLFLISTTPLQSSKFLSECFYIVALSLQLILYCFFGNEVTLQGLEIPYALWESDWLGSSYSFRKNMIFTMIRMQKPIYLTAGNFAPLTLATFVAIIKGSYSFFAFLNNVNG